MEVDLIFKIAAVGIIVSILGQVLSRSGREEQAMLLSAAGVVIVLLMVVKELGGLITTIRSIFGL